MPHKILHPHSCKALKTGVEQDCDCGAGHYSNLDNTVPAPGRITAVLDEAAKIVDSSRQVEYNDPVENAVREALVMSATLGTPFTPKMMVLAMHTKKLVRSGRSHKHDNVVDKAGYAEIEERVEQAMKDGTVQKIVEKLLAGWVSFKQ